MKKIELTEEMKKQYSALTKKKVQDNIYSMLYEYPFYANLLTTFHKEITFDNSLCPVAAVTIKNSAPVRITNPLGYLQYSRREAIFIDIHEILHITYRHHLRMGNKDPGLWNIACDIEINQLISSTITTLPTGALMYYHYDLPKGLTAEEYYSILENREEPITLPPELQNTLLEDLLNNDNENNNQNNSNQSTQKKSVKAPGFEKLHPHWSDEAEKSADIQERVIKHAIEETLAKTAGSLPRELEEVVRSLFKSNLNWPNLLSSFTQSLITCKSRGTWSRPSKKYGSLKMGRLRTRELNLWFVLDTSGSFSKKDFETVLPEIQEASKYANIHIVQCDTKIQRIDNIKDVDFDNFIVQGRGGTSFTPVFDLIQNGLSEDEEFGSLLLDSPDGIVYLTDGFGAAPDNCDIPTLWVITNKGRIPYCSSNRADSITWGNVVYLPESA